MRQMVRMFLLDLKMSTKSFMTGYMLIVPVVILLVLRGFLPSVAGTSANIAVVTEGPNAVDSQIVRVLESFADVSTYDSVHDMGRKLRGVGSAEGLYWDPAGGQYVSVLERSTGADSSFSIGARVVRQYLYRKMNPGDARIAHFSYGVPPEFSDRTRISPVATMGGAIFFVYLVILGGFIIGLGMVTDKEEGTNNAIKVSPVSKADYFVGKSIYPLLVAFLYTIIGLAALKLTHVSIAQTYVVVLVSFSVSLLLGLLMGAVASNENEAIGLGKLFATVVLLSILGGTLLPPHWRWAVWWSPLYWVYDVLNGVFTGSAGWGQVGWECAVIAGSSFLYFLLLRKKIVQGLA